MKKFIFLIISIASGCIFIANLSAQENQVINLDNIVVTASRIAQHDYKITGNVTVIDKETIKNSKAQTIPDLMKEALGVNIYDNSTSKTSIIDLHGYGDTASRNTLVLINDQRINNIDISGPDLVRIPIESVERIEIIRGAGSVLYGDNAVGGVINIITKKGKGPLKGKVGYTYGGYDAQGTDLEIQGSKNKLSYLLFSKYFETDGYRKNSGYQSQDFSTRLGYAFSPKISTDLSIGWHKDDYEMPGGLSASELFTLGRRASADPDDFASTKDRFVNLGVDFNPMAGEELYLGNINVNFYHRNRDAYDSFNTYGEFATKRSLDTTGITAKYIFNHKVFDKQVNFVTGVDYYDNESDIKGSGLNPDDLTISKEETGIFGYAEYEALRNTYVNGGLRYQQAEYAFSQRNVLVDEKQRPDVWVYMGGMKYEYGNGSNIFFNIQKTFRFLATDEWYSSAYYPPFTAPGLNTSLKQQAGMQYELGIKHNLSDAVMLSLTPYWTDNKDEIFYDPQALSNSNYDKTRRLGIDLGSKINLLKFKEIPRVSTLDLFTNYSFIIPRFTKGIYDKNDIPLVARHQSSFGITTKFLDNYNFSLTGKYVGSRFAVNDTFNATSPIKPHCVVDTKLSFTKDFWELFVAINNVFNEKYSTYVVKSAFSDAKDYYPNPERNFNVGMNVRF